jgi:hypothetical protein
MDYNNEDIVPAEGELLNRNAIIRSPKQGQVVVDPEHVRQHNTVVFNQALEGLAFGWYPWTMFFACRFGFFWLTR